MKIIDDGVDPIDNDFNVSYVFACLFIVEALEDLER